MAIYDFKFFSESLFGKDPDVAEDVCDSKVFFNWATLNKFVFSLNEKYTSKTRLFNDRHTENTGFFRYFSLTLKPSLDCEGETR